MEEQIYPSGRVVKNVLDDNGDLSMVQSKKNADAGYWNHAQYFTYAASGAVTSMQLGNDFKNGVIYEVPFEVKRTFISYTVSGANDWAEAVLTINKPGLLLSR